MRIKPDVHILCWDTGHEHTANCDGEQTHDSEKQCCLRRTGGQMLEARKGFVQSCEEDVHYRNSDPQWTKASIHAERGGPNERPWSDAWQVASLLPGS